MGNPTRHGSRNFRPAADFGVRTTSTPSSTVGAARTPNYALVCAFRGAAARADDDWPVRTQAKPFNLHASRGTFLGIMRTPISRVLGVGLWLPTIVLAACAGSSASDPPKTASSPAPEGHERSAAKRATPPNQTPASPDSDENADEGGDPATLEPVVSRDAPLPFSRAKVREKDCWQTVALQGDARQDYDSLVEHCGTPTGSFEYAKPGVGTLDSVHDKDDTFIVFLRGGLCYRFFGVGDASIPKLNIVIERNGSLEGEARANGSVAIINTDKAWCIDSDAEYRFLVQVGAQGHGRYVFGVWARRPT